MYPVTQHGTVSGTQLGALHLRRQLTLALWVELTEGHLQLPHVVHDLAPDLFVDDCLAVHFPEKYVKISFDVVSSITRANARCSKHITCNAENARVPCSVASIRK